MKKLLLILFSFVAAILLNISGSYSQNCNDLDLSGANADAILPQGFDPQLGAFCAPLTVDWYVSFGTNVPLPAGATVEVIVNWGDGPPVRYDALLSGGAYIIANGNGNTFMQGAQTYIGINNAQYIYGRGKGVCQFIITARLSINGIICNDEVLTKTVNYWDTDEDAPGSVNIEPELYQVCAGDQVNLIFDDNTVFNCVDPSVGSPNQGFRKVRWTYNTTNTAAPGPGRIDGITLSNGQVLNGSILGDQNYIPPTADIPGSDANSYETYPANVVAGDDVSTSLQITVPASATVGQIFEVRLENWGPCNPLGNTLGRPAIERYALIEIVAPPQGLSFTISETANGSPQKTTYCPGEDIRFRGNATNHNGNFRYRWIIYDGPADTDPVAWTRNNDRNTWLADGGTNLNNVFSSPGTKLVRMFVENSDTNFEGSCEVFFDRTITITPTPIAQIGYDIGSGLVTNNDLYEICLADIQTTPLELILTDESTGKSINTRTSWVIDKTIPTPATVIDVRDDGGNSNARFDYPANPLIISDAGEYRIRLFTEDASTSCTSIDELIIRVYDTPVAAFNATEVCAGNIDPDNRTFFSNIANNLNGITPRVNNDEIIRWTWDFSYDAVAGFNIEEDFNNNNNFRRFLDGTNGAEPTASIAGDYSVALVVETAFGCTDTLVQTVTVKLNPDADIEATYTNDYLTNTAGDPYTGDPICPGTFLSFTNTSDLAFNADAELLDVIYELEIEDFAGNSSQQTIGDPGSATETIETNAFTNSTATNQTYQVRIIATANNGTGCITESSTINVIVLPGADADFLIFDGVPGDAGTNPYSAGAIYCSPYDFYFETDANTQSFGADEYVWTVTDAGTGTILDTRTVVTSTDPNPEQYTFLFENNYPSASTRFFDVNLAVVTGSFCVNSVTKTVKLEPQPTGNFTLEQTVETCPTVTLRFRAEQLGLGTYSWVVTNGASAVASTIGDTPPGNSLFVVEFNRPPNGAGDLNYTVELTTQSVVGCPSLPQMISGTIAETELIPVNVDFSPASGSSCLPAVFDFQNNTGAIPAGTTWSFEIRKEIVPASGVFVLQETLEGVDYIGNEDFTTAIQYEFTAPGLYQVDLLGTANSECIFQLSTPQEIRIYDTPEVRFKTNITEGCSPLSTVVIQENSRNIAGTAEPFNMWYEVDSAGTVIQTTAATPISGTGGQLNSTLIDPLLNPSSSLVDFFDYDITVFAENAAGCIDDSTYTVRVFKKPFIEFQVNSPNPACEEDFEFSFGISTNEVPTTGTTYRWNFGDGLTRIETDPNLVQIKDYINRNQSGGTDTYTVSVTAETAEGCSYTATETITLHPTVRPGFIRLNDNGCSPFNLQIRGNAQGTGIAGNIAYETRLQGAPAWTTFAGAVAPNGDATIEFINTSGSPGVNQIYEIRQIVTGNGPCSRTSAVQLFTVFPKPETPIISGSQIVCENEMNVEYAVLHTAGNNYEWNLPEFAFISRTSLPNRDTIWVNYGPTPTNPSPEVRVTITDNNFCRSDVATLPVNVVAGPTGSLALGGSGTICPGEFANIIVTLTGPGTDPSIGFDVVINDGFTDITYTDISNGEVIPVSPTSSRNYFIKSIVDREFPNCPGRPSINNIRVNVNTAPTATIAGNATICEGSTTDLRINMSGLAPWIVEYTDGINPPITVNSNSSALVVPVSPTTNTTYSLVSVRDASCIGTVSADLVNIEVNPAPSGSFFIQGDVGNACINEPVTVGFVLFGNGPWTVTYEDNASNLFSIPEIPEGPDHSTSGTTVYVFDIIPQQQTTIYSIVEIVDVNGCSGAGSNDITITTFPVPVLRMTDNVTICEGESANLIFNFLDGVAPFTVDIAINDVDDTLRLENIPNGHIEVLTPLETTNYRAFSVVDANGCPAYDLGLPVRVRVRTRPTVVLEGMDSICYGEETPLTFTSTGVGPWTIRYTDGTDTIQFITPFNRHFEDVSPLVSTQYTVVSVTDANTPSCSNTGTGMAEIVVAPELIANFTATPENMILEKRDVDIVNETTNKNAWSYVWDFGDSTTSTAVDPGNHVYPTYGTYFLRMTATNGECTSIAQTIITIEAIPAIVDFVGDPIEGCLPLTVNFENLTQFAEDSSYLWSFGDNQSARIINPIHTYTRPGVYTVRLSANNITGLAQEEEKVQYIRVFETPQSNFSVRRGFEQVFTGDRVEFSNSSVNADQYLWDFGDGNESTDFEPVHIYSDSGIYNIQLIATNSSTGCSDTLRKNAQVLVIGSGEVQVPNAFTPSRAGVGTGRPEAQYNDFFLPQARGVSQYDLKIYNRWGELLFESDDKDTGWDGYFKGELMPMGVYVYRLELVYENGRREVKLGDVTLIR